MEKKLCIISELSLIKTASDGRQYKTMRVQEMPFEMVFNPMTNKVERVAITRQPLATGFNVWRENINGTSNIAFDMYAVNQPIVGNIEKVITEPYLLLDENKDVVAASSTTIFVNWDTTDTVGYAKQREVELKNSGRKLADVETDKETLAIFLEANRDAFLASIAAGVDVNNIAVADSDDINAIIAGAADSSEEPEAAAPATPASGIKAKGNAAPKADAAETVDDLLA